jgi:hypothetical protein
MSLVGPRPHDVHELQSEGLEHDPRLSVRPGLTGLWQIYARSNPNFASRVHHDLEYVGQWSLFLDAKILAKTVPVVLLGKGGRVDGGAAAGRNGSVTRHLPITNGAVTRYGLSQSGLSDPLHGFQAERSLDPAHRQGMDTAAAAGEGTS